MPVLTKINTNVIADNAVTGAKIPAGAVAADIGTGGISANEIAADAVTSVKIGPNITLTGASVGIPSVTTANRPGESGGTNASITAVDGMLIYNSTIEILQQRANGVWQSVSAPPTLTSITPTEVESAAGGNVTFTIAGTGFLTGDTITFIANSGSDITSGIATTVNSAVQITVVVAKNLFVEANEPYDVKISSVGGTTASLDDSVRVDNSPSWAVYVATLSGSPPVVASIMDNVSSATHATLSAVDPESDTIAYTETTSILTNAGMSLASATGIISGTPTSVGSDTNYDFTSRATSTGDGGASVKTTDQAFRFTITNFIAPTGGTIRTYTGFVVHVFTSNGNFVVGQSGTFDIMTLAGGGMGGAGWAGGGGAGELLWVPNVALSAATYACVVGGGGTSGDGGDSGDDSNFGGGTTYDVNGGGGGGGYIAPGSPYAGLTGGSSGGAGHTNGTTYTSPAVTKLSGGHGNVGSVSGASPNDGGGGGGAGAAAVVRNPGGTGNSTFVGGVGTTDTSAFLKGALVGTDSSNAAVDGSSTGVLYLAGGGGGSPDNAGGVGGGGTGTASANGGAALANTGSGGGGCDGHSYAGGYGGSGLVIIRYAV